MTLKPIAAALALALALVSSPPAAARDRDHGQSARLSDPTLSGPAGSDGLAPGAVEVAPARAPRPSPYFSALEIEHIRAAVADHIRALARRDMALAYSHLAPATKDWYASPSRFLAALATDLAPVLDVRRFALAETERDSTDAVQVARLVGAGGAQWLARFTVERQPDGRWGIKRLLVESAAAEPRV